MVTLTFDSSAPDPLVSPEYYSKAWDTFLKRLRRRYPHLRFARIVELTGSGRPHFHVLVNHYLPQKYVSWAFSECGGGKVADCRYIQPGRAARYVTKYITKTFDPDGASSRFFFLSKMRSVSTSRGLYYSVPRVKQLSLYCMENLESCDEELWKIANNCGLMVNKILIDDPRAPPFVWVPDAGKIDPLLEPRMSFPLTHEHLMIWALDLSNLPDPEHTFIDLPDGLSLDQVNKLQTSLFPHV